MKEFAEMQKLIEERNKLEKPDYLKLENGTKIRIISEIEDWKEHNRFQNPIIKNSTACIGNNCVFCKMGTKTASKYSCWIIDRTDNKIKFADLPHTIVVQLGQYALSEDFAYDTVPGFDITIGRTGTKPKVTYSVTPSLHKPLTDEELEAVAKLTPVKKLIEGKLSYARKVNEDYRKSLMSSSTTAQEITIGANGSVEEVDISNIM